MPPDDEGIPAILTIQAFDMAFENLEPYRDEIISLRRPGANQKKLKEVVGILQARHGLDTTVSSLSRYLSSLKNVEPGVALREPTGAEGDFIDTQGMLLELQALVDGRSKEQRAVIEDLAGKIRVNTATIEELEKAVASRPTQSDGATAVSPAIIRKIWMRAFLMSCIAVGITATGGYWSFQTIIMSV